MELMRQLAAEHKKIWDELSATKKKRSATDDDAAQDCDPVLLSGWTDRDISLWNVSAAGGKPSRQDILLALCRNKKKSWEKISYLVFPKETVCSAGLILTATSGKTGEERIDNSRTHFEIKGITGKGLCTLLFYVSNSDFETGFFTESDYNRILLDNYDNTKRRPVVESDTSQTPRISLPSSGTGVQEATTVVAPEQALSETPTTKQTPTPSSSIKYV